jgi:hypothetical protein
MTPSKKFILSPFSEFKLQNKSLTSLYIFTVLLFKLTIARGINKKKVNVYKKQLQVNSQLKS